MAIALAGRHQSGREGGRSRAYLAELRCPRDCVAPKIEFEFELDFFPVGAARRIGPEHGIFEIVR